MDNLDYLAFLRRKIKLASFAGFEIADDEINPILKPHQRACVKWAVRGGNRALFERFGLGKSVQQLEIVRLVMSKAGGPGLIVCPLGVRQEFKRDGEMLGIQTRFIRRTEEVDASFTAEGCIVANCPLQFDIVDRLIERYSNPGETVYDPFGGLMTVPYRAILKGRKGRASELNTAYFFDGVQYLRAAEREVSMPSLFDGLELEEAA